MNELPEDQQKRSWAIMPNSSIILVELIRIELTTSRIPTVWRKIINTVDALLKTPLQVSQGKTP